MRKSTRAVTVGSGAWRGRVLRYPGAGALRPTMQRTKHSLFSSLGPGLRDAVFVDAFAGAGGVGIEALSLGARRVHFVEKRRDAIEALRANLAICGAPPARYDIHHAEVAELLARARNPLADASIIYADPPYEMDVAAGLLDVLRPDAFPELAILVVEHRTRQTLIAPAGMHVDRERRFGETTLTYLVPSEPEQEGRA